MREKLSAQEMAPKLMLVGRQLDNTLKYSTILAYAKSRYIKGYADDELFDECKKLASKYGVTIVDDINPKDKLPYIDMDEYDPFEDEELVKEYRKQGIMENTMASANIPHAFKEDGYVYVVGDKVVASTMLNKVGMKFKEVSDNRLLLDDSNLDNDTIKELNQMFNLQLDESIFMNLKNLRESLRKSEKSRIVESNNKFRHVKLKSTNN